MVKSSAGNKEGLQRDGGREFQLISPETVKLLGPYLDVEVNEQIVTSGSADGGTMMFPHAHFCPLAAIAELS